MFCDFVGVFTIKTGIAQVKLLVKRPINGGNVGRPIKAKIQDLCKWKSYLSRGRVVGPRLNYGGQVGGPTKA